MGEATLAGGKARVGDGRREPIGYCSFEDEFCPSGQRYGERRGGGLSHACVEDGGTETDTEGLAEDSTSDGGRVVDGAVQSCLCDAGTCVECRVSVAPGRTSRVRGATMGSRHAGARMRS